MNKDWLSNKEVLKYLKLYIQGNLEYRELLIMKTIPYVEYLIKERSYSKFSRSFTLPEDVDSENLTAKVTNGVLSVTMPRKVLAAPKRIAITAA